MKKIKNIILDYGDVIFMIDFLKMEAAFSELGIKNVRDYYGHRSQTKLFDEFEQGKISSQNFREGIRTISGIFSLTDHQIDSAWNAMLLGVPDGNHDLLLALKNKYRLFFTYVQLIRAQFRQPFRKKVHIFFWLGYIGILYLYFFS